MDGTRKATPPCPKPTSCPSGPRAVDWPVCLRTPVYLCYRSPPVRRERRRFVVIPAQASAWVFGKRHILRAAGRIYALQHVATLSSVLIHFVFGIEIWGFFRLARVLPVSNTAGHQDGKSLNPSDTDVHWGVSRDRARYRIPEAGRSCHDWNNLWNGSRSVRATGKADRLNCIPPGRRFRCNPTSYQNGQRRQLSTQHSVVGTLHGIC
jgi:hypothetical protein